MKKFKTFNINKWKRARTKSNAKKRKMALFLARHPLTWLVVIIAIVYTYEWWIG